MIVLACHCGLARINETKYCGSAEAKLIASKDECTHVILVCSAAKGSAVYE